MKHSLVLAVVLALPLAAESGKTTTARSGPLQLTFELKDTHVKLGDPVWYKLTLTNVGKSSVTVIEALFGHGDGDMPRALHLNHATGQGLFISPSDSTGKPLKPVIPGPMYGCGPFGSHALVEEFYKKPLPPEMEELTAKWRRQGVSPAEMQKKLDAMASPLEVDQLLKKWRAQGDSKAEIQRKLEASKSDPLFSTKKITPGVVLAPGQSISTPGWSYPGDCPGDRIAPTPPVGFVELFDFNFTVKGTYTLRAVYNRVSSTYIRDFYRRQGLKFNKKPEDIRIETAPIKVVIE